MHPSADPSDCTANATHLTYEAANKIIKKLSPDMVDNIFKFISGEEVMRTTDIALILSCFGCKEIMSARRVSKKWRDAAKMTVPSSKFVVDSVESYNDMRVMTTALPNLQQLSIYALGDGHKYCDGEDPDEAKAAETADHTTHDIDIISNFTKLRSLCIDDAPLNGSYPVLFNFPLLQKLTIWNDETCNDISYLKWNLDMLSGLPSLKELDVFQQETCYGCLSGNVRSLRVLKDTLEKVDIKYCQITGNFMDLADFPHLKMLILWDTDVTGDIRDICGNHFPAMESLTLPQSVRGGVGHKFQHVFEVPSFMHAIHRLLQRNPNFIEYRDDLSNAFSWSLSHRSPDWYHRVNGSPEPPFALQIIQAGSRFGWSWCSPWRTSFPCEINWLDPEPSSESDDYEAYIEDLRRIEQHINFYRGYNEPPTAEEYRRLCDGLEQRD